MIMPETLDPPATTATPAAAPAASPTPAAPRDPMMRHNPAFESMAARVAKRGKPLPTQVAGEQQVAPVTPESKIETTAPPTPEEQQQQEEIVPGSEQDVEQEQEQEQTEDKAKEAEQAAPAKKDKKLSPWRLLDDAKKTLAEWRTKAEAATAELERIKAGKPQTEAVPKEVTEKITKYESRIKELEDHLRYVDYQKHPEFIEKYQKPYDAAWKRAMTELGEVGVTDASTGAVRAATADDMLKLVTLPLGSAIAQAKEMFGEYAPYAIDHRNKIKELFDAQNAALNEAREKGSLREKETHEKTEAQRAEISKTISQTWEAENRAAATDPKVGSYFVPVEGDQEGNTALAKGYALVDKAFAESPQDPNITAEERSARIKRHVALRNRAAAFGRLRRWHEKDQATISELRKELEQYKASEPPSTTTSQTAKTPSEPSDPYERMKQRMMKRAR